MTTVLGVSLDAETRCAHYHGPTDIVAIRFKCCGEYYACKDCHIELADHPIVVWPEREWDTDAIQCGHCAREWPIRAYMAQPPACPSCSAPFNPRCRNHYHFYFDIAEQHAQT